ncbi:alcohol dehydrogenase catalytic domain-containing protein [Puia sp. P3]|uniref:zinc-dependent alcohol dehydrogenase family protein n=1 Tax=Puia sp. P3 TaxID=3423952 RepID=UPI003D677999
MAAQWVDLLWPVLLLLNVEHVDINKGDPHFPLEFTSYPISHSLLMGLVWGAAFGLIHYLIKKDRKAAIILGLCVPSHWLLDLIVHKPDLPLVPGNSPHLGLGLWNYPGLTALAECLFFTIGLVLYLRSTHAKDRQGKWSLWLLVSLLVINQLAGVFFPLPTSAHAIGWAAQYQVDLHHPRILGRQTPPSESAFHKVYIPPANPTLPTLNLCNKTHKMKSIQLDQWGIQNLRLRDIPTPCTGENEVLVRTTATALEFHDLLVVENRIPFGIRLPYTPLTEGVGTVEKVGSRVTRWKKGDRVMIPFISRWESGKNTPYNDQLRTGFSAPGLLSEYTVQPENTLVRTPDNLTDEEAAQLPVTGLTAWAYLVDQANMQAGQTLLTQGTGGVSLIAIQLAKMTGLKIIATTGNSAKEARLRSLGAGHTINYNDFPKGAAKQNASTTASASTSPSTSPGRTVSNNLFFR